MFFERHGVINYQLDGFEKEVCNIITGYTPQTIKERLEHYKVTYETPESLSKDLYGDVKYYWIILMINNIVNPYTDWVMDDETLRDYCMSKYGDENINRPNYFYNYLNGKRLVGIEHDRVMGLYNSEQSLPANIFIKTNYDVERELNDDKRDIYVLPKSRLTEYEELFYQALKG